MPLVVFINLIEITDNMSSIERIKAETANKTVETVAQTLKDSPMNEYDKGDRKVIYTLTADMNNGFTRDVQIIPIK